MAWDFKSYWARNKARQNAKRRRRYQADPRRRKKAREQSREYYDENIRPAKRKDRTILHGPKGREYFSIGKVAKFINRAAFTIRSYERRGIVPVPTYYDGKGWRLYTREQAVLMRKVFKMVDVKKIKLDAAAKLLKKGWS